MTDTAEAQEVAITELSQRLRAAEHALEVERQKLDGSERENERLRGEVRLAERFLVQITKLFLARLSPHTTDDDCPWDNE